MTRGGKRPGAGRPRGTTDPAARRSHLHMRAGEEERARWEAAATLAGQTLTEWVRETLDDRAERDLTRPTPPR